MVADREAERRRREAARAKAAAERAAAQQKVQTASAEVDRMNRLLQTQVAELHNLLAHTLSVDDFLDFEILKDHPDPPAFDPGQLAVPAPVPSYEEPTLELPGALSFLERLVPGRRRQFEQRCAQAEADHDAAVRRAEAAHTRALQGHKRKEQKREAKLAEARNKHEQTVKEFKAQLESQHLRIEQFRSDFEAQKPEAVCAYFDIVLQRSSYPQSFPKNARLAFVPASKQLVLEYDLPSVDCVPTVASYRYVRARSAVSESPRPLAQRKQIYASVVAQVTIRTLHELFEADRSHLLDTIVLNGHVNAIDRGTGQETRPCLVTVRTTRAAFEAIDLRRVEPLACLHALNASVSRNPAELSPVRPVLDFNMVDPRFVDSQDVIAELDQRPNLMELTPTEFEGLVANLFGKMGLEMRQTRPSRDGGVDCVAHDPRPILGGKVVIQAKRYKNTVGVAAVRDLFGTVHNEGASKGILVTTSGYGQASFEFAQGKPLELLDGANLLYLLAENAGIEAKIEPPEDWVDPVPET